MRPNLLIKSMELLFFFATFVSIFDLRQTKEFCEAFKANDYHISYGFRRMIGSDSYKQYVFINSSFWELEYRDGSAKQKRLLFKSMKSTESSWFGNQYSMAFCLMSGQSCTAYLLDIKKNMWTYGKLDSDTQNWRLTDTRSLSLSSTDVEVVTDRIGFVPTWGQKEDNLVILFKQKTHDYKYFKREGNDPIFRKDPKVNVDHIALYHLSVEPTIVAIFGQYSVYDYELNEAFWKADSSNPWGHGVVILFRVGTELKYCYTSAHTLNEECKPENLKLLVNCTLSGAVNTTKAANPTAKPFDKTPLIVLGVIVVIIILVSIIVLLLCLLKNNEKQESIFKGMKPPMKKDLGGKGLQIASKVKSNRSIKSEAFSVKSNVDYSKPIPLKSSAVPSSESIRPTDLNVKPK